MAIDGIVPSLQEYFSVPDTTVALSTTLSTIVSTVFLIFIGLAGGRFSRKTIIVTAASIWLVFTVLLTFLPRSYFWVRECFHERGVLQLFLILRAGSAPGFAILHAMAPVVFADFFEGTGRGRSLMGLTIGPVIGGFLGMNLSSFIQTSGLPWQISMLFAPILAFPLIIALFFLMPNYKSSAASGGVVSMVRDVYDLFRVKTYTATVLGVSFGNMLVSGSMFWLPTMFLYGYNSRGSESFLGLPYNVVLLICLFIPVPAMFVGMPIEIWIAENWRDGTGLFRGRAFSRAFPLIIFIIEAIVLLLSVATIAVYATNFPLFLVLDLVNGIITGGYMTLLTQQILDVLSFDKRAAGMAFCDLIVSLLESPAPVIFGALSDYFRNGAEDYVSRFAAFQNAIYVMAIFGVVALAFYAVSFVYYPSDRKAAETEDLCHTPLISRKTTRNNSVYSTILEHLSIG